MNVFARTALAFALAWICVAGHPVAAETIDDRLYDAMHNSYRSPELDVLMKSVTRLGDPPVLLAGALLLATYRGPRDRDTSKLMFTALAGTQTVVAGLKFCVNRPRPEGLEYARTNSSFPSGHAAGAFAVATVLSDRYRSYRLPFYAGASAVCLSRVYLGKHYPADVVAGALLGYVGARVTLHFEERVLKVSF